MFDDLWRVSAFNLLKKCSGKKKSIVGGQEWMQTKSRIELGTILDFTNDTFYK